MEFGFYSTHYRGVAKAGTFVVVQRLATIERRENKQRSGDAERHDPDDGYLDDRRSLVGDVTVAQRVVERHVAVDGDHAQVADGRRRKEHIQTVPGTAQQLRDRQARWIYSTHVHSV